MNRLLTKENTKMSKKAVSTVDNDRASHYSGRCIFGYNSAPAAATEVLKPSTDAESLLGSIKKMFFDSGEGFAWGKLVKWGCFRFFNQL